MNGVAAAWRRFWFAEQSAATVGVWRIAFGVLATLWTLSLARDLHVFFTSNGLIPEVPDARYWVGVFDISSSWPVVVIAFAVLLMACIALTVGWHTRLAAVVVFVGILSFERRAPNIFNSGDTLVRNLALYLALAPAGLALSLDRRRHARARFWEHPTHAMWPLRLVQLQLVVIYLSTVWAKVRGDMWNDGTAISYALRLHDLVRFSPPSFLVTSETWSNLLSWGTLAVELAIPILVWNRRTRAWALLAGIALHLSIELTIDVGFFSLAMLVAYLTFVPGDAMASWLDRARSRLRRRRGRPVRRVPVRRPSRDTTGSEREGVTSARA